MADEEQELELEADASAEAEASAEAAARLQKEKEEVDASAEAAARLQKEKEEADASAEAVVRLQKDKEEAEATAAAKLQASEEAKAAEDARLAAEQEAAAEAAAKEEQLIPSSGDGDPETNPQPELVPELQQDQEAAERKRREKEAEKLNHKISAIGDFRVNKEDGGIILSKKIFFQLKDDIDPDMTGTFGPYLKLIFDKLNKDTDKNIDLKYILQDYKPSDDSKNIDLLNDDNYEEVSGNLELKNVFNIRELLKEIIYAIEQKINIDNKGGMTIKTNETDSGR